jgi:CBS domain-containing protein
MLRLRDIMTTNVLTLAPDVSLRDAMELLASHHFSGAPVVAGGRVVGVISSTDILDFAANTPGVPSSPTNSAEWGEWDTSESEADEEAEPPASFFTELWSDAGAEIPSRLEAAGGPEWDRFGEHTVEEVMNRAMVALPPDTPVELAAAQMRERAVHRILVMQGDELKGLVTTKDVTDAVADHRLTTRTYVFGAGQWDQRS